MRLRHKKNAEVDILNTPLCINIEKVSQSDIKNAKLDIESVFPNPSNPLHLELGMGKGKFITTLSRLNPNINYIGIEKSATIVLKAISDLNKKYNLPDDKLAMTLMNLRFICTNIETLDTIFKKNSVDKIYLNFSDPWPKKRHEVRRLTHTKFLSQYEQILKPDSLLEFKTDNLDLFNFSLEQIKNSSFKLLEFTYDLHNDSKLNEGNIMTEYEEKFSKKGNKICKLVAKL